MVEQHDALELERTLLDNKLRKATDKLEKLEANEAASESRAVLVVAIDGLLHRLQRVLRAAEKEEEFALLAIKAAKEHGKPTSPGKGQEGGGASWQLHKMTDSDRALFKLVMMDNVDGLANMLGKMDSEEINALNTRGGTPP
jgi:predicted ribosome quality control (RQC) complex YloA/Tae2 family protein